MLLVLANGDFHVAPNALLILIPLLTLSLVVLLIIWLIRWTPRGPHKNDQPARDRTSSLRRNRR